MLKIFVMSIYDFINGYFLLSKIVIDTINEVNDRKGSKSYLKGNVYCFSFIKICKIYPAKTVKQRS